MVCLSKDRCKTATLFLLISMSVADTAFLITVLLLRVLPSVYAFTKGNYLSYMVRIMYVMVRIMYVMVRIVYVMVRIM